MLSGANRPFVLSVIILNVVMLSVIVLNVVMLSVIMFNVVMLSVVMVNVMALAHEVKVYFFLSFLQI
jgi:hypothetical protein